MDEMAEPRGLRGYLMGQNDGPGGKAMPARSLEERLADSALADAEALAVFAARRAGLTPPVGRFVNREAGR